MAFLSWRAGGSSLVATSAAIAALGCSFVLDTTDLHNGGAAEGGTTQSGTGGSAGASAVDAASDAPMCTFPDRDPCNDCLGMHCCGEINGCTHDRDCNLAYVDFQQCERNAKKAANPVLAGAACTTTYRNRGGTPAALLLGCTLTNCSAVCGT